MKPNCNECGYCKKYFGRFKCEFKDIMMGKKVYYYGIEEVNDTNCNPKYDTKKSHKGNEKLDTWLGLWN